MTGVARGPKFSTLVQAARFICGVNLKGFDAIAERVAERVAERLTPKFKISNQLTRLYSCRIRRVNHHKFKPCKSLNGLFSPDSGG